MRKQEQMPIRPELIEDIPDAEAITPENAENTVVTPKESEQEVSEKIQKVREDLGIESTIKEVMAKKPDGSESLKSEPIPETPVYVEHKKSLWKKAMTLLGFTGAMVSAHAGATAGTSDTTAKEQFPIAKEMPVSKPVEESPIKLDQKKLERAGIVRIDPVESKDTTKQVYLISLKGYKSYDDILNAISKAGFESSSAETMIDVAQRNGEIIKKSRNLMSLKYVTNKLGNMSAPTITYDIKRAALHPEARELNVGIDSDYEQYRFVVEVAKPKTARYEDGLAKN